MSPKRRKAAGRKPARARRSATARKPRPGRKRQAPRKRKTARKAPAARKPAVKRAPARRPNRRAAVPTATVRATPALESMVGAAPESVAGALEVIEVRDLYRVRRGEHVFVTVNVDAAQLGEVSLSIDQTPLGTFTAPVASRDLGLADDLLGKLLIVEAIVSDVSGKSDALRIRTTLTGGPSAKTVPASGEADESGGSAHFRVFVLLKE